MRKIAIWYNPNTRVYSYKLYYDCFNKYYLHKTNQFGHEIILIIDLDQLINKPSILKRVLSRFIRFLQKINKRL